MSEVKTRKQEVLALLDKAHTSLTDWYSTVNWMTAERAGRASIPAYSHSVDECLTLISDYRYTVHHLMGSFRVRLYPENADVEGIYADARYLSVAILKAWWTAQPDET